MLAVCVTGVLSIGIPFGLLLGKGDLVTAGVDRQVTIPAPQLTGCAGGQPIKTRLVRPGQCLQISGRGFGSHELIEVTESRRPGWRGYLRADGLGDFSWRYRLPTNAGQGADVLAFRARSPGAAVPVMALCPFTVAG